MEKRTILNQLTNYKEINCLVGNRVNDVYEIDNEYTVITIEKTETENYMMMINHSEGTVHFGIENIEEVL